MGQRACEGGCEMIATNGSTNRTNHQNHWQTRNSSSQRRSKSTHFKMHKCQSIRRTLTILSTLIALTYSGHDHFLSNRAALAFNVDTSSALVHRGPQGSYFGYTVAQHKDRGVNWLLVGAPKAQTDQPRTKQSGAVYRCAANNNRDACQQILFDPTGSSTINLGNETVQSDDKSHQWFGASLASANDNGSIIACAPNYIYYSTNLKRRDPVGSCWVSRGSFSGFLEFSPCRINDQWGHHHMGSCQAGFSSAITKDGSKMFMGAPGSHVWQGQAFAYNSRTHLSYSTSAVNPHSEDDSYLGYSLAVGKFSISSHSTPLASESDLAIGIPRGADLSGKIMIVDKEMRTLRNITGEQMGAYFGYSIATADVNGDGYDDLLIGAPMYYNQTFSHKEPHYERGRIYVALQTNRHDFNIVRRIDGQKNRGRFGTAVANCGDLNRDGYQDIAVGAPYDGPDNHGAVYIYMGRKSGGLGEEYDQVIYAEQIKGEGVNLRSFGFSLSGGYDMDSNQYPDILVGDYEADRAVLLKTRPVANVTTTLTFTPENFNLDDKSCILSDNKTTVPCVTVTYCSKYTGLNVDGRLNFIYNIKLDTETKGAPRMFFLKNEHTSEETNSISLYKDASPLCRSFRVYILKQTRDKLTPLKIDIDYNLADTGDVYDYSTSTNKVKPVLNKSVSNKMSKTATIQKNCGPDSVCVPDLKLSITPNMEAYTIGSNEKLILDVTVRNYGEDAYESMFYLTMPMTIQYNRFNESRPGYPVCYGPKLDQTGVNMLTCDLGNPLLRNDVIKFQVITEPANGDFSSSDFTFIANVNSTNPEQDDRAREDNQVLLGIPIKVEVNLVLSGNSNPSQVAHNLTNALPRSSELTKNHTTEADLGPEVTHVFQLQNKGPSTINDIAVSILWPTNTADGKCLLYLVDEPIPGSSKVVCRLPPEGSINPLNLLYVQGNKNYHNTTRSQLATVNNYYQQPGQSRYRRQSSQSSMVDPASGQSSQAAAQTAASTTVDNSILHQLNHLGCSSTQCTRFECNVYNLSHDEIANIKIRSRLCEETLNTVSQRDFDISSRLVAQVKSLPYNVSVQSMPPYVYEVDTHVLTSGISVQNLLPWWVLVLAILLGVALFILLACFLKYLGFFTRKRPPPQAEREPLTPTIWNEYQYSPGDTAL